MPRDRKAEKEVAARRGHQDAAFKGIRGILDGVAEDHDNAARDEVIARVVEHYGREPAAPEEP